MRNYKEQSQKIMERILKYKKLKEKQRKTAVLIVSTVAFVAIIISCTKIIATNINENGNAGTGVYIAKIKLPEKNDNEAAGSMIYLIVYKGKIYTEAGDFECNKSVKDKLIGGKLGYASGTLEEWSKQDEFATEFASTSSGAVYSVNGYDTDFRICIPETSNNSYSIRLYENLNNVTLENGEDLYGDRLQLSENYTEVLYQLHADWDFGNDNYHKYIGITSNEWNAFIDSLYSSKFVDVGTSLGKLNNPDINQAHIYFKMKDGTNIKIRLLENGYVRYEGMFGTVFVKMNSDTFQTIFNASLK